MGCGRLRAWGFTVGAKDSITHNLVAGVGGWIAGLGVFLYALLAQGQTLNDTLISAYNTNPTLQAQRAKLRSVDEGVPQALSNWRPTVTFTGQVGRNRIDSQSGTSTTRELRKPETYNLTVRQPLFRGGRTLADTSRAKNEVLAERSRLAATEQGVLLAAATAHMDVVRDQAVVRLTTNNVQVLRQQLEATRERFLVGELTRTDVSQAEARLARAKADRIQAEGGLEASRATYQQVVGVAVGELAPPLVEGLPPNLDEALGIAAAQNFDVVAARFAEKAARDTVNLVEGERLPEISVTGEIELENSITAADSTRENLSVIVTLTIPLYQAGSVSSRVREAKQIVSQRRIEIEAARRVAAESAKIAWGALMTARARIQAFSIEIRSNKIALEGVRQGAMVGARTVLDVLDAEQELLNAQVNLVRAQRDEFVAANQLLVSVGRLTARHLGLPMDYYDEVEHYKKVLYKVYDLGEDLAD